MKGDEDEDDEHSSPCQPIEDNAADRCISLSVDDDQFCSARECFGQIL